MADTTLVLLVGHCGPDAFFMRSTVGRFVPGAEVRMVNDQSALDVALPDADLLLVNRVLDGKFDASGGIDMIGQLSIGSTPPPMMLVSNYADAQEQAEAAGALPGFGKSELGKPQTRERIESAVRARAQS